MSTVEYEVHEGTAVIRMNRPEVKNAINTAMHEELYRAFSKAHEDTDVRVILLTGSGGSFSSGADLKSIPLEDMASFDHGTYLDETYNRLLLLLDRLDKPTAAYLNGPAVGAGLSIALACDFRWMHPEAYAALSFLQIGLVPDAGASYFLPRIVGYGRALDFASGRRISPEEAVQAGLVTGLSPDVPEQFLQQLAQAPLPAYGLMKENMRLGMEQPLEDVLEAEVRAQRKAGRSRRHVEAVQAFVQRSR
ncbi:enoyl-CoA hydratase/isomerase family protein [Alkalicoccus urumqiensis]|uniref:Enoyl-CoA hydratase n=1 Tax=Alkalicoccus urumqiensis TaxID=1548213 RepID=A0A2P6MD96_ALKUR|nr:enoyl-CoA hydratase/isomerase family protein [Alkalicoccus urumqiensis]PRO64256.1 enoyl-CoA hydratase [Alkalicoccus urumqiensis]